MAATAALLVVPVACSGGASSGGTGGSPATGTGGISSGSGGHTATGGQPATGGTTATGAGGSSGGTTGNASGGQAGTSVSGLGGTSGAPGQSGGSGGNHATGGSTGGGGQPGTGAALSPTPAGSRLVITGVRGVSGPATLGIDYLNGAASATSVTGVTFGSVAQVSTTFTPSTQDAHTTPLTNATLFQVTSPKTFPASVAAGGMFSVGTELTTASGLPTAPAQDSGSTVLSAVLTLDTGAGAVQTPVYAVVLTQALWEPTLGEILYTLGYKLNVGKAQNNSNPNRGGTPQSLPGVESGTDEVSAQLFVKAGAGNVSLIPVARFSPIGPDPFGWYPSGTPATRNVVGTMAMTTDPQTSNKARMVLPPLAAGSNTTFDPGTQSFGIWVYTDEASQKYDTGTPAYGDYDYSQDSLNSPANVHRFKAYPLKDSSGANVADSFLLACEEAANGDYQDFVFVLRNAKVAP